MSRSRSRYFYYVTLARGKRGSEADTLKSLRGKDSTKHKFSTRTLKDSLAKKVVNC